MPEAIQTIDFSILDGIQTIRCPFLDFLMPLITMLGDNGIFWIAVSIALLFFRKYRTCGIASLGSLLTGVLIGNVLIKNLVMRDRPCWINETINMLIEIPLDYSFPSGHTTASFTAATVIFLHDKRLGIPAYIIAVAVAFSRMYLYVHFPTDILVGAILGTGIAIGINALAKWAVPKISAKISARKAA